MSVLRIYTPAECYADGVPLDWERCRACCGSGMRGGTVPAGATAEVALGPGGMWVTPKCMACDGHGSLKAAALAGRRAWALAESGYPGKVRSLRAEDGRYGAVLDETYGMGAVVFPNLEPVRCEDCGHPMSEGTWEGKPPPEIVPLTPDYFWQNIAQGDFVFDSYIHYSPCDSGCRHGGPMRALLPDGGWRDVAVPEPVPPDMHTQVVADYGTLWASWRPVDVRCLSWPHDLRPEMLAVLCLRCFAERER